MVHSPNNISNNSIDEEDDGGRGMEEGQGKIKEKKFQLEIV